MNLCKITSSCPSVDVISLENSWLCGLSSKKINVFVK